MKTPIVLDAGYPERVIMGECWARDGLQNEARIVPTHDKIGMITTMVEAGFKKIEATNFAHPRYLPQFADAEQVLAEIPRRPDVAYRGICTNQKGISRAIASKEAGYGVDEIAMVLSASDPHNRANVNMTVDENKVLLEEMARRAIDSGHEVFGWVLTSFGCPIQGDVPVEDALATGQWWKDIGATWIGFGDTTGVANPRQVERFYAQVADAGFTRDEIVIHFHDTRGCGIPNSMVALAYGYRYVDSSLGAIGGQPKTGAADYHTGFAGNSCTEDLVCMLEEMGMKTGVDLGLLLELGGRAEKILGRQLRSNVLGAGPVPHEGVEWDRIRGIISRK